MKLLRLKKIHLIGIKGQGMTALAEVLKENGIEVSGSDTEEVFTTDPILKKLGIPVNAGFSPENIPKKTDAIVYSTAYTPERNEELGAAFEMKKVTVLSYPEALGQLTREKLTLAVAGTHGKTTTSALLAEVLRAADLDPSAIIGSQITNWRGNALAGKGQYFVLEADEYQNKLAQYSPLGVILTSVDWDHPDFFPTVAEYEGVFEDFVTRIPRHGFLVACGDSASVKKVAEKTTSPVLTYGFHPENEFTVSSYVPIDPQSEEGKLGFFQRFSIDHKDMPVGSFRLRLSGKHNALNATAVIAVALHLKLPLEKIQAGIESFRGTKRRFEKIGERRGGSIYDDYAHHPEEIQATLSAFNDLFPSKQLTVIFHPHTFTRTKALLQEFAQSFDLADSVVILPIYGSAREEHGGVSSEELVALINRYTPQKARFVGDTNELIEEIRATMKEGDVVVTMGAGDVWQIAEKIAKK